MTLCKRLSKHMKKIKREEVTKQIVNKSYKLEATMKIVLFSVIAGLIIVAASLIKAGFMSGNLNDKIWIYIGMNSLVVIPLCICVAVHMMVLYTPSKFKLKNYFAYMTILVLGSTMAIFLSYISPYLIPVAFVSLLIFSISSRVSLPFVLNLFCSLIVIASNMIEFVLSSGDVVTLLSISQFKYVWATLIMGIYSIIIGGIIPYIIKRKTNRSNFIISCCIINCIAIVLIYITGNVNPNIAMIGLDYLHVIIAVFIPLVLHFILVPIIETIFNLVTESKLVELVDPNQPLIKRLMQEAPGTFNHSMAVANFAEICANAIGEDVYLVRAAAYYHDIGKLENPRYFAENQAGYNPTAELLPEVGAQVIRSHTEDGYKLCQEFRIPEEIASITLEHHGTMPIKIFYEKAKQLTDGEINVYDYSHHTNKPQSKIAAIIMICDTSEAAIRAMDMPDGERVSKLLSNLINERIIYGQFDECDISLKELHIIKHAIIEAYGGLYHKRIKYPDEKVGNE